MIMQRQVFLSVVQVVDVFVIMQRQEVPQAQECLVATLVSTG